MILPNARTTAVRAPDLTPRTLIQVRKASSSTIVAAWPTPWLAPSQRYPTAREKKTDRLAIDAITRDPGHPADLEPDELPERRPRVDVGAAGPVEEAPRLGEAQDEEEHGEAGRQDRPDARGAEQLRRGHGQDQIHAAPDDVVDRERHDLPAGDGAEEAGGVTVKWCGLSDGRRSEVDREIPARSPRSLAVRDPSLRSG